MDCPSKRLIAEVKKIYFGNNVPKNQVMHDALHLTSTLNLNQEPIIFQVGGQHLFLLKSTEPMFKLPPPPPHLKLMLKYISSPHMNNLTFYLEKWKFAPSPFLHSQQQQQPSLTLHKNVHSLQCSSDNQLIVE